MGGITDGGEGGGGRAVGVMGCTMGLCEEGEVGRRGEDEGARGGRRNGRERGRGRTDGDGMLSV